MFLLAQDYSLVISLPHSLIRLLTNSPYYPIDSQTFIGLRISHSPIHSTISLVQVHSLIFAHRPIHLTLSPTQALSPTHICPFTHPHTQAFSSTRSFISPLTCSLIYSPIYCPSCFHSSSYPRNKQSTDPYTSRLMYKT
jgi:hypothetical protein